MKNRHTIYEIFIPMSIAFTSVNWLLIKNDELINDYDNILDFDSTD